MTEVIIKQTLTVPELTKLEHFGQILLVAPGRGGKPEWSSVAFSGRLQPVWRRRAAKGRLTFDLSDSARLVMGLVDPAKGAFERLTAARRLAAAALEGEPNALALVVTGFDEQQAETVTRDLVSALLAARARLPQFKRKPEHHAPLGTVHLFGLPRRIGFEREQAEAAGNALARELTALPGNRLTPGEYRKRAEALAKAEGWKAQFYSLAQLEKKGAGAFLAVARASGNSDAGILRLRYRPEYARGQVALVGKGICFDTGGLNIKGARGMQHMAQDMAGSAAALGTLLALSRIKAPLAVDCWLALTRNDIGPQAFAQGDVISAVDGTTIEVVHTDAEGRLVLADTLALAAADKPDFIVDYATLTGSCVDALGSRYSGALTNREALNETVIAAGRASGERVWPFPMDDDYDERLESKVADVLQCTIDSEADHILAARFLKRFVKDLPWVHLDLAAASHSGGLAHIPTDITGFGVRFSLNLLLDQGVLKNSKPSRSKRQ